MNVGCNERRFDEMQSQQENEVMKLFYYKLMSFSVQLIFMVIVCMFCTL